ncbi:Na/Pi symporter [Hoeflea sp. WL0058]|uniref:Na/Pi symporter n=1 Tax=Flavimaribacter sediminis TaxID=2865987 RepID=A0AAE2ZMK9_9HYPH|nr:Na/Pi symporter [Flavimaribacter sediminis]MBW8637270.1 Na/Pi symporter [Flavimaribacter sediminis]
MTASILHTLGGVGLFLLGMIWLTEGLRGLSGDALRNALARFTRTPFSGAVTGAIATAAIQSSSATTVTAVGFVSAGLLTFPQALGVIFGANIGTTITGWLVAILGFKLHLGEIVLPFVFVGALLRLFGGTRASLVGTALAGFSLLFMGIDAMQSGMAGFEGIVTPTSFPDDSLFGRLQLVLIGVAITLVTQSSSAGVATALAALGAGAINFPQAAAMVIGMDVGTTFTAALATLGGATAARRTGLSHVIYNVLTGVMAFFLLGPFSIMVASMVERGDGQVALVAFHTSFNLLGVLIVLPFAGPFARLITVLVPERGPHLTNRLGRQMLSDPDAATDAVTATVDEIVREHFSSLASRLDHSETSRADQAALRVISDALDETRRFVDTLPSGAPNSPQAQRIVATLHILDHLQRLYYRCTQTKRLETLQTDHRLRRLARILQSLTAEAATGANPERAEQRLNRLRRILRVQRDTYREHLLLQASNDQLDTDEAILRLDALRWLHRVVYHLWRIQHHVARMHAARVTASPRREAALEILEDR